jgi:hypothetical protein
MGKTNRGGRCQQHNVSFFYILVHNNFKSGSKKYVKKFTKKQEKIYILTITRRNSYRDFAM